MSWNYNRETDRWVGHDHPGAVGSGMHQFVLDELELGARAAVMIGDPEQAWWEIHAEEVRAELEALNAAMEPAALEGWAAALEAWESLAEGVQGADQHRQNPAQQP